MPNLPSLHLKIFFKASALKWAKTLDVLLRSLPWVYSIWPKFFLITAFEANYKENACFQKQRAITQFIFEKHRSYVHFHVFSACKMRSFRHIFNLQNWQLNSWGSHSFPSTQQSSYMRSWNTVTVTLPHTSRIITPLYSRAVSEKS